MSLTRRSFVALAGASALRGQQTTSRKAKLAIQLDGSGPTISKHIYGHFAEHLGHCIYGGIWVGPDSPIPNTRGIRNDIVAALRKMQIPNLRWPGGCFADQYEWRAGIGPREKRPRSVNIHWGGVIEDNSFGTHEFLDLCGQCGAEPYIAANVGSGTPRDMADWIEYMTHSGDTTLAEQRRANGRDEPWEIPFLGVGNENWGCGGNMTADYYADLYRRFAAYARSYGDGKMMRVAGGPSGGDLDWIETLMRRIPSNMEAVSLHFYTIGSDLWSNKVPSTGFDEDGWMKILQHALHMETLVSDSIKIMDEHDPDGKVKLYVDEWGTWYTPEPGRNPSFLYQENTIRDALVAALTLHIFHNHAERVTLANLAQLVNVLQAPILTEGAQMVLTPTYHVLEMFTGHHDTTALPLEIETDYYVHGAEGIPAISASASRDGDGNVHLSLANVESEQQVEVSVEFSGRAPKGVEGRLLAGASLDDRNTFASPHKVEPKAFAGAELRGTTLRLTAPPRSVITLKLS